MKDLPQNRFPSEFHIIKKIGRGGTADIYLARKEGLSRPVVLKKFYDPSASDLIEREKRIARRIHFPGFVRVLDWGKAEDNSPFLRMEYCEGPTLEEFPGNLTEKKLLALLSALTASLNVLHQAGFVHNDLKPSNVFCPPGFENSSFPLDSLFYLKLADFSLAHDYSAAVGGSVTGTVGYMSPEMILKGKITPASDLFSLGVMAYQLACGKLPFASEAGDPLEINALITEGPRPPMCGPGESFSEGLSDLIMALLEIDPSRRPNSAFVLLEELSRLGSPYPFRKAIRPRHLLGGTDVIDGDRLIEIFGNGSFSPGQIKHIEKATGFEPAHLRILLEENFDRGNFARMDGRWGWKNESAEVIEWSRRQDRFSLSPLRGKSLSVKKLALGLAVIGDPAYAEKVAGIPGNNADQMLAGWKKIPEKCRPALLYSLGRIMRPSTRRALSNRLVALFRDDEELSALTGRLLYNGEQYQEAIEYLKTGIEISDKKSENDITFELIDLSIQAAQKLNDFSTEVELLLRKARLEKDLGRLIPSETTYNDVVTMLNDTDNAALLAQTYREMGEFYKMRNDYQSGIKVLEKALRLYNNLDDPLGLSNTLNNLGNTYWVAGDLKRAITHYERALKIQEELNSDRDVSASLNNIGVIHTMRGDYDQAITCYNKSLQIYQKLGNKAPIAQLWNNLGAVHFLRGDAVQASESFAHSLKLNREVGARAEELLNIENLAEATILAGRLPEALKYLKEGTELADKLGETSHKCTVNRLTGQLLRRMGYYDEAEAKLETALDFATEIDNRALILLCQLGLARMYRQLHEHDKLERAVGAGIKIADEMGDKNALFHLALIQVSHTGDENLIATAKELVSDLDTARDKALLYLTLLERQIISGIAENPDEIINRVRSFFDGQDEDIDLARYHLALAGYFGQVDERRQAFSHANKASETAGKRKLLPEQWQALAFLSELQFQSKEFESSFKSARHATECLKMVAAHIKDTERLGRFYNDNRIIDLLGRIKSLQSILGKKKGAAEAAPHINA